jgi:hypothetical protein
VTAPLCFLDTETTGVHPGRRVWEVGMIRRESGHQAETQFFVDVDLSLADPFGLNVGGFYERHPYGRYLAGHSAAAPRSGVSTVTQYEAARKVARWTHGAHIVGAVPNFDTEVLGKMLRAHGLIQAWHYHLIDVEALAVGYLAGVGKQAANDGVIDPEIDLGRIAPPWKSHDLSAAIGVASAVKDEHTALGDARWAMRVYDAVMSGGAQ